MSIVVTIVKSPGNASCHTTSMTFSQNGGTIGRGARNTWTLDDPERFISTQHSQITYDNNQFFLVDLSTNGTFHNGASVPIGKGNRVALTDGDKFSLSDYEFLVNFYQAGQNPSDLNLGAGPFASEAVLQQAEAPEVSQTDRHFSTSTIDDFFSSSSDSFMGTAVPFFSPETQETDPLMALDKVRNSAMSSPVFDVFNNRNTQADNADILSHSVKWPESSPDSGIIPDDWDLDNETQAPPVPEIDSAATATSTVKQSGGEQRKDELHRAHEKILAEIEALKKQTMQQQVVPEPATAPAPAQTSSASSGQNDYDLIKALGFDERQLSEEKIAQISQLAGEVVRETVIGMMKVLSSRSTIKNEFRMNVTTIQPKENNPLKFSANIDDAMENMFIREGKSYIGPVFAIREGFDGIAEHQLALLAGVRSAFRGVLEKFNPELLEQRFGKFRKGGIIPGGSKAKNWEMYCDYYQELLGDMDNAFQHLFGYDFVKAYEDQLYKLTVSRKTGQH